MQETWKFNIDQKSDGFDETLIENLLRDNKKEMGIFLSYYFKKDGAIVENVSLNGNVKAIETGRGKFQVTFDLIHFNACLNIHDQNLDKMDIEYNVNNEEVILTGPYWPERGQDEI